MRLTEAHLVCQDATHALETDLVHPGHALELVLVHGSAILHALRLLETLDFVLAKGHLLGEDFGENQTLLKEIVQVPGLLLLVFLGQGLTGFLERADALLRGNIQLAGLDLFIYNALIKDVGVSIVQEWR